MYTPVNDETITTGFMTTHALQSRTTTRTGSVGEYTTLGAANPLPLHSWPAGHDWTTGTGYPAGGPS